MKAFSCGDVVPGCDAKFFCSSDDDVLHQVAVHARESHGLSTVPTDLIAAVRSAIVTAT